MPEVHLGRRELPGLGVPILHQHVGAILCCIVDRAAVLDRWVYIRIVLGSGSILNGRVASWDSVCGIVVQVHLAGIRIITEYIFVKLGDFFELI